MIFVGEHLLVKAAQKTFRESLRKFGQKSFATPKNSHAPKPMMKRHLRPRSSPFERTEG